MTTCPTLPPFISVFSVWQCSVICCSKKEKATKAINLTLSEKPVSDIYWQTKMRNGDLQRSSKTHRKKWSTLVLSLLFNNDLNKAKEKTVAGTQFDQCLVLLFYKRCSSINLVTWFQAAFNPFKVSLIYMFICCRKSDTDGFADRTYFCEIQLEP